VPARFRDIIRANGDGVMVSRMDSCLLAYTFPEWHQIESRILALSEKSETMRRFRRVFIGGAFECTCDKQERILVPPSLRQYAALDKEIVLVGVLDHFEIWSRENWDSENWGFKPCPIDTSPSCRLRFCSIWTAGREKSMSTGPWGAPVMP